MLSASLNKTFPSFQRVMLYCWDRYRSCIVFEASDVLLTDEHLFIHTIGGELLIMRSCLNILKSKEACHQVGMQ